MGIAEIIALVFVRQVAVALKNVCNVGASGTVNATGKEAWKQGAQIADTVAQAAAKGLTLATGEFAALQTYDGTVLTDEKSYAAWVQGLPLPTP